VVGYAATSNNEQAVTVSAASAAAPGRYDIVVSQLARAQVTASGVAAPDSNATTVATGGTITIGGVAVAIAAPVTLAGLASAINGTDGIGVTASVSETAPGSFRLILSARNTGAASAFTIANSLTGSTVSFTDTNGDNISGDSAADNAVQALNAALTINNVAVSSATNTLTSAIEGVTLTLHEADPAATIVVDVDRDDGSLVTRLKAFVTAYNELATLTTGGAQSGTASIGRDSMLRGVRNELRAALSDAYGTGTYTRLAEVGLGFTRTGQLELNEGLLAEAMQADSGAVASLFADATGGAFAEISSLVKNYTTADGVVPDARTRLADEISRLGTRIADMEARLALRREALRREFTAADEAMSRLTSQSGALAGFGARLNSTRL